jgi:hypothetical protein
MEKKTKKRYEKPTLKGATAFEAAAALCCKAALGSCNTSVRTGSGKATRLSDSS